MQERDRRTERTLRELEAVRRKNDAIARELHETALKQSREALAGIRATLTSLHSAGPPTASEFLRIHRLRADEALLLERIKFHEAELAKLGAAPKP
jgi:hypothetical protein